MVQYIPYTDGAGPTEQQQRDNTQALANAVGGTMEYRYCELLGESEWWAVKNGRACIYDRWGFCSEDGNDTLDQASWDEAVAYLQGSN